jgi:hypothetical protein
MTTYPTEGIQPGWSVWTIDGQELGTVVSVDAQTIHVKKGGLLGGQLDVPRSAVDEIETGRVELSVTKKELAAGS